jgi:hypothetical protein
LGFEFDGQNGIIVGIVLVVGVNIEHADHLLWLVLVGVHSATSIHYLFPAPLMPDERGCRGYGFRSPLTYRPCSRYNSNGPEKQGAIMPFTGISGLRGIRIFTNLCAAVTVAACAIQRAQVVAGPLLKYPLGVAMRFAVVLILFVLSFPTAGLTQETP